MSRTGRPRGDAAVCAILNSERWTLAQEVAERIGKRLDAAYVALWRAEKRGLVEHKWRYGYRLRREPG